MKVLLKIDEVLESRGRTAYWLAKELGMGHGNLYMYRKNKVKAVNLELLGRMCTILECEPADLLALRAPVLETKPKAGRPSALKRR